MAPVVEFGSPHPYAGVDAKLRSDVDKTVAPLKGEKPQFSTTFKHSITLTARPPWAVALYLTLPRSRGATLLRCTCNITPSTDDNEALR
jgi:hypothetical protein